jgi:D-3-phosphoglycerate dehydrogenase
MKIVISDKLDISDSGLSDLKKYSEIEIYNDVVNDPVEIMKRIEGAEIITANYIDITREVIINSPNLKYIISPAVGYDWIDVKTATEKGIKVVNCPTFNTYAVAEHAIGLIFSVYRRVVEGHLQILEGKWQSMQLTGHEVKNKKFLSIGYGNIGKPLCGLASALGMDVKYCDSKTAEVDVNKLISEADIVALCYPLTEKTKGSFDAKRISLMKSSAILINVARGRVLDQDALYMALKENKILGAGLDVFNDDATFTKANEEIINFAKLPNVVVTPHVGFNTEETKERFGGELIKNIDAILAGNPINVVN